MRTLLASVVLMTGMGAAIGFAMPSLGTSSQRPTRFVMQASRVHRSIISGAHAGSGKSSSLFSHFGFGHGLVALALTLSASTKASHWLDNADRRRSRYIACAASAVGLDGPKLSIVVFGATGYIGRAVVKELMARGHSVIAFVREKSGIKGDDTVSDVKASFGDDGDISVITGDVMNEASISRELSKLDRLDGAVCCLASRTGGRQDSFDIDYQATVNCHSALKAAKASQFVLLSAICVQKPLLAFQEAKLKAEAVLKEHSGDMVYSIVQPTAFFKSLLGQVKTVKGGSPYVMFGDGSIACKPISEEDLAAFIGDCFWDPAKKNATLPVGGPGKAMTFKEQGTLLFELQGKEPNLISAPVVLFDVINGFLDFLAGLWPEKLADIAEYGKIGKYYATECMLVLDKETNTYREDLTPSYGRTSLKDFLTEALQEGSTKMQSQQLGAQGLGDRLGVSDQ